MGPAFAQTANPAATPPQAAKPATKPAASTTATTSPSAKPTTAHRAKPKTTAAASDKPVDNANVDWKKAETDWKKFPIKEPVSAIGCKSALAPGKPNFIEFRSRTAQSFGHTFMFFGRLGGGNKFASYKVAGLHPAGLDPGVYAQGILIPVPAETGVSWGDTDEQYLTARFCVTLTDAEFAKVTAYIKKLQSEKHTWHGSSYNCNSFAADVAKFMGLDTPNPNFYLPETFVTKLGDYNKNVKSTALKFTTGTSQ